MNKNIKINILIGLISILFNDAIGQNKEIETGMASYYDNKFHGRKTSSGEKYDKAQFTAAHRTLPFNTKVRVTNLKSNKSVIVRINDRGPFSKGRVIDLSRAAAEKIGLIREGVAKVKIEILDENDSTVQPEPTAEKKEKEHEFDESGEKNISKNTSLKAGKIYNNTGKIVNPSGYGIQLISVSDKENLIEELEKINNKFKTIYIEVASVKSKTVYRIIIGSYRNNTDAKKDLPSIKKEGYNGFIKKF